MDYPPHPLQFILLLILSISPFSLSSPSDDINSLLEFKKAIIDPTGTVLSSWAPSPNAIQSCPSTWIGVTCEPTSGAIIGLNLSNLKLSGELKFTTLTPLKYLQTLSLAGNAFTGRLVPVLGSMTSLSYIDLSSNQFYGSIPDRLTDLSGLVYLNLSLNNFTQGYPPGFGKLQNLRTLDLRSNGIWGDIGGLLSQLRNIEYLDLSNNLLTGLITVDPNNLTSLGNTVKYMNLSYNRIQGGFFSGTEVGMFRNLEVLDLGFNMLTGELPSIANWYNLKVLKLGFNRFFGMLPQEIFQSSMHLIEIDLSGNAFTGSIPIINSTTLKILNLSSNSLSGPLTGSIGIVVSLDLSNNMLSSDITLIKNWGNSLQTLDLSSNNLFGSYPENSPNFQNLIILKIQNNSLTGNLPSDLGNYPKLQILILSLNKLTGSISPSLFTLLTLTSLNLSSNGFTGQIPIQSLNSPESLVLPSYTHLEILDLSSNYLTGNIPPEMGNMQRLKTLNLARNNLTGQIPTEMEKLNLETLNLSYNDLSGTIPKTLQKFPKSSFFPGNPKLQGVPTGTGTGDSGIGTESGTNHKMKPGVRVALIVGCTGSLMILIFVAIAVNVAKNQNLFKKSSSSKEVVKLGREQKDGSAPTTHSRSLSSQTMLASGAEWSLSVELELSPQNQHICLDIHSPDRLAGELTFVDQSLTFTAEELSKACAEVLGRSTHGTSYKASLDRGIVLRVKWMRVGLVKDKKEFGKEAKRVGLVKHGNLVGWRGFYWGNKEQRFIVSDFVTGGSLALYLYESTPRRYSLLSVNQRLKICIDLARALHFLHHEKNLPHGNLKPSNILLTNPDLTAKLTDFGLHRIMSPAGIAEQILNLGALGYRAPELVNGSSYRPVVPTFKGDVYAFGVIVMEMLTRRSAGDIISGQAGAVDLTDWVSLCNRDGRGQDCFNRDITGLEENSRVMDQLLNVSLRCIRPVTERPDIKMVLDELCTIAV